MAEMTMVQALNSAMDVMLARDPDVVIFGEDVGFYGGVFRVTEGLQKKHGETRVFDTPIAEGGMLAVAVGMGAYGLRPIVEIQFADYIYPATDQLISSAARLRYRSGGEFWAPITVRAPSGGGIFGGQTHSQSVEAIFTHVCGLKTVIPSNPYDAKGLLISAVEDDDPVVFFEPKRLYHGPFYGHPDRPAVPWTGHRSAEVPEGYYTVPLGKAAVVRDGAAVTVLVYGTMVHVALAAAEESGIDAEIIDLRTLLAARHRHDRQFGQEDRPLCDRARGDPHLRLRRRIGGAGAGELLLPSRSADRARDRLGHALSARARVGLFPRSGPPRRRPAPGAGGLSRHAMGRYVIKVPDIGEGMTEAEIVAWHVAPGQVIREEDPLVDVMTDKATVELPAPVAGTVVAIHGQPGERRPVGSELIVLDVLGEGNAADAAAAEPASLQGRRRVGAAPHRNPLPASGERERGGRIALESRNSRSDVQSPLSPRAGRGRGPRRRRGRVRGNCRRYPPSPIPTAAPSGAKAARLAGGAAARLGSRHRTAIRPRHRSRRPHHDAGPRRLCRVPLRARAPASTAGPMRRDGVEEVPVIGLRRAIAEHLQKSTRQIPHFSYIEEVDVTALEELRAQLNETYPEREHLTLLPFLIRALPTPPRRIRRSMPATTTRPACCTVTPPCMSALRRRPNQGCWSR